MSSLPLSANETIIFRSRVWYTVYRYTSELRCARWYSIGSLWGDGARPCLKGPRFPELRPAPANDYQVCCQMGCRAKRGCLTVSSTGLLATLSVPVLTSGSSSPELQHRRLRIPLRHETYLPVH